ncbi:MAG TPA: ABC transporter permease [Gemmatimonadaceae bacterium]|nr:ABC transporter permease [Gemmatimonadaceae bacterium]
MSVIDGLRHRVRVWLDRDAYDREMDEEVRHHLALDAAQHVGPDGRSASEAELIARRRFGNRTFHKEERRRVAGLAMFDGAALDARHLTRWLRRSPGFAALAILTIALGIGVTTAVVSIADHVLVRSLPFGDTDRLMMMVELDGHGGFRTPSAPTAEDWRQDAGTAQAFDGVTYVRGDGVTLRVGDEAETVGDGFVSPEFFPLLKTRPLLGRTLLPDDQRADAPLVAVITHRLWQRRFGGDRAILGRSISIDSIPTTVVGVMPPGAVYPPFADVWQPITKFKHQDILLRRGFHADSRTLARLRAGVDSARAMAFMQPVARRLAQDYPADQAKWMPALFPVRNEIIGNIRPMLLTLAAGAAAVLLLACANVAGLLLARVTARSRELAVRGALGASRGRVVRQLLTESLILSALGGVLGTALAAFGVKVVAKLMGDRLPRVEELVVDQRVLLVAASVTLLTALLCGVWPALRATRHRSSEVLRASASGAVGLRRDSRLRRMLVTVQFALALMLLVGAGLLMQSFRRAAAVDVGFDPRGVLTFRVAPPSGAYAQPGEAAALYDRLMVATRAVPGVVDAAFINHAPFGRAAITTSVEVEGRPMLDSSNQVFYRTVSGNYLDTMHMALAGGRWFDDADLRSQTGSFVINQAMAKLYWPGTNAIGQRITVRRASQARADFGKPMSGTVVGVVRDVHQQRQDVVPDPEVYVPYTTETWPWGMLVVRTRDGVRSSPALLRAIKAVDPRLVATGDPGTASFTGIEDTIAKSLAPRRFSMTLISAFAACALLLAGIGMYGVVAYGIAQRTREIGVRKALGATDGLIVRQLLRETAWVVVGGVVLGCGGAWAAGRLIRGLLFDTQLTDPGTFVLTIGLLGAAALGATLLPARRATRLDPTIAMRGE